MTSCAVVVFFLKFCHKYARRAAGTPSPHVGMFKKTRGSRRFSPFYAPYSNNLKCIMDITETPMFLMMLGKSPWSTATVVGRASGAKTLVASFTKEINSRLAKRLLVFNGRLANFRLTSVVKEATGTNGSCPHSIV